MQNPFIKILYVDDEVENLLTFKTLFRRFFSVKTAESAKQAIELLEEENFDVVLSDQRMPNMTGLELCEYVSQHHPSIRRYIVTGYSEAKPLDDAISAGTILSVIMKPWDMQELKSLIATTI